jgi:hypothetical protein
LEEQEAADSTNRMAAATAAAANLAAESANLAANLAANNANLEANNAILAAKARSRGARVRQELDNRRFEVGAACSKSLARIEDEIANDVGSAHGLDAVSVNNWVDGTHDNMGPEGDIIAPFVTNLSTSQPASGPDITNVTEPVMTNVDPYTTPFGTTTLSSSENPGNSDHNPQSSLDYRISIPGCL